MVGLRWLVAAGVALAMPKCLLCVLGYGGLVAGAGWFGPELCGGSTHPLVTMAVVLAALLGSFGVAAWLRGQGNEANTKPAVRKRPGRSLES